MLHFVAFNKESTAVRDNRAQRGEVKYCVFSKSFTCLLVLCFSMISMEDPGLSSESDVSSGKNMESIQPGRIAEIITDDDLVIRRLMSCRELPPSRYTSLSVMLNAPKCKGTLPLEEQVMVVRKTDVDPMSLITLQPVAQCAPYYDCLLRAKKKKAALSKAKKKRRRRKSPVQHDLQSGAGPSWRPSETIPVFVHPSRPLPFPHSGVMWPLAFASAPPYSTPGYESLGTKQPVGVVPVQKIPWRPSAGIVGGETVDVPTWVSPLYRSYGIGGPFGPYGPFIDPEETAMRKEKAKRRKKPDEKQKAAEKGAASGATKPGAGSGFLKWLKNIFGKKSAKPKPDKKTDTAADKKAEGKTEPPPEQGPDKDAQNVAAPEQVSDQDTSASSKTSDQPTPESSSKTDVTPTSESERSGDVSLTSSDEAAAPGAGAEHKMEGAPGPQASHEESEKPKVP